MRVRTFDFANYLNRQGMQLLSNNPIDDEEEHLSFYLPFSLAHSEALLHTG